MRMHTSLIPFIFTYRTLNTCNFEHERFYIHETDNLEKKNQTSGALIYVLHCVFGQLSIILVQHENVSKKTLSDSNEWLINVFPLEDHD